MSFSVSGVGGCLEGSLGGEERRVRVLEREWVGVCEGEGVTEPVLGGKGGTLLGSGGRREGVDAAVEEEVVVMSGSGILAGTFGVFPGTGGACSIFGGRIGE